MSDGHKVLRTLLRCILLLFVCEGMAQPTHGVRVVVADAVTRQPVARASLYTRESGHFYSCISNSQGVARMAFPFQRLTISHLNYEKLTLPIPLPDTVFLQPRYETVGEVVVTNKEPEWIRRKLKQVVKQKEKVYFSHEGCEHFVYDTQSLGTNSLYRFHLTGLLRMKDHHNRFYAMLADTAAIVAVDSTRLTDTSQLRRMLYEDFMAELDGGFVNSHRYHVNYDYQGRSDSELQIYFRSKNHSDDRGWIVVDTARCTVLSAWRSTGTKTNRQERTNALLYHFARLMGYRIDSWTRDYRVAYASRSDGTLYPAEVRYIFFFSGNDGDHTREQEEFDEQTGGGFPNMEATLTLNPSPSTFNPSPSTTWIELPPSWYIKYNTDEDRRKELELSNLPATFTIYEGD